MCEVQFYFPKISLLQIDCVTLFHIEMCSIYDTNQWTEHLRDCTLNPDSHSPQPQPPFSMIIPSTRKHYRPNRPERPQFDSIRKSNVRLTRFRRSKAVSNTFYRNAVPLGTLQSTSGDSLSSCACSTSPHTPLFFALYQHTQTSTRSIHKEPFEIPSGEKSVEKRRTPQVPNSYTLPCVVRYVQRTRKSARYLFIFIVAAASGSDGRC